MRVYLFSLFNCGVKNIGLTCDAFLHNVADNELNVEGNKMIPKCTAIQGAGTLE